MRVPAYGEIFCRIFPFLHSHPKEKPTDIDGVKPLTQKKIQYLCPASPQILRHSATPRSSRMTNEFVAVYFVMLELPL
ncbi:MAG: hypothetical protein C4542_06905 [Dehalococcoidia bacterium]|nr:MAG: hypothetical protein C4542_06905 [Dehalococcoidia bacterium]